VAGAGRESSPPSPVSALNPPHLDRALHRISTAPGCGCPPRPYCKARALLDVRARGRSPRRRRGPRPRPPRARPRARRPRRRSPRAPRAARPRARGHRAPGAHRGAPRPGRPRLCTVCARPINVLPARCIVDQFSATSCPPVVFHRRSTTAWKGYATWRIASFMALSIITAPRPRARDSADRRLELGSIRLYFRRPSRLLPPSW